MKKLLSAMIVLSAFASQAFALGGIPQAPVSTSQMTVTRAVGVLSNVSGAQVTVSKQMGAKDITGVYVTLSNGQRLVLNITSAKHAVDAAWYTATDSFPTMPTTDQGYELNLTSTMGFWSVQIYSLSFGVRSGEVDLRGQPRNLYFMNRSN